MSNFQERHNLILFGDTLGDPSMADGMIHVTNELKIGFLNYEVHILHVIYWLIHFLVNDIKTSFPTERTEFLSFNVLFQILFDMDSSPSWLIQTRVIHLVHAHKFLKLFVSSAFHLYAHSHMKSTLDVYGNSCPLERVASLRQIQFLPKIVEILRRCFALLSFYPFPFPCKILYQCDISPQQPLAKILFCSTATSYLHYICVFK